MINYRDFNELDLFNFSDFWNISDYDENPETQSPSHSPLDASLVLTLATYALTMAVGVPGNVAVMWVTCRNPRTGPSAVFFLHLAAADLAYCLTLPCQAANLALHGTWPRSLALCKLLPCTIMLNMFASVFLLTLVSADRCTAIIAPFWSLRHRTPCLAHWACSLAWLLACLMCLPSLLTRKVAFTIYGLKCSIDYSGTLFGLRTKTVVEVSRVVFAFGLPMLVIAICYLLVGLQLWGRHISRPLRLATTVVAAFMVCWLPYHACGLALAFATQPPSIAWDHATVALASFNSALNPLLYVFAGHNFCQVLSRSLTTSLRMAFAEERPSNSCSSRRATTFNVEATV
ncbi:C5a anaphylatoxin chemotactic receptor 1-like [Narcine bancroftii]|uniref:C5a anaphylatoxin chemotactic receptor 1-like n=1 Tax=Narcine bancroftii TaxID=1343680 RepID=UPI003832067C